MFRYNFNSFFSLVSFLYVDRSSKYLIKPFLMKKTMKTFSLGWCAITHYTFTNMLQGSSRKCRNTSLTETTQQTDLFVPLLLFLTATVDLFQVPFGMLRIKIHSLCHPFACCCFSSAFDCKNVMMPDQILLSHRQNYNKTSEHSPVLSLSTSYFAQSYISVLAWFSKIAAYVTVIRLKISYTSYQTLR